MDKNTIIGFVLIILIFVGFSVFETGRARKNAELQAQADSIALAMNPVRDIPEIPEESPESRDDSTMFKDTAIRHAYNAKAQIVAIENSRLKVEFNTRGAQPHSVMVKDYYNYDSTELYLFRPGEADYAISVYAGEYIRSDKFTFEVAELTDSSVTMRLPFSGGGYIEQKYILHEDSYRMDNLLSFVDMDGVIPGNVSSFDIDFNVTVPRMEKGYRNESQYSKLNYYYEGDKKPEAIGNGRNGERRIDSRLSWFAFQQQFFSVIMRAPREFSSGDLAISFYPESDPGRNLMDCSARMRADLVQGGGTIPFEFYLGPNHFQTLKSYDHKYEKIIPLGGWLVGWFTRFAIIPMFNFFGRFIDSFGLVILLMTIVIKLVVLPFTYKSYASSAKMGALKPEIDKINAKYPHMDNQQEQLKKQQAMMNLYKRAGVSPMGGCLPMLLTFPILWAMFRFFPASIELRQQPFLWCDDLSAYDSILDYGTRIPILGDHLSLFALLMAVTMWVYSKFTLASQPNANDPSAASMRFMSLWLMPIMMFFICNQLSAALSYYYLLSQLISILETVIIRKSIDKDAILEKVRASEGKPMPKSKWQQRIEEAQRIQEQQLREQRKKQGRK
ncbi:MAG TPA: membrane protein insertase YidC [Candidatus Cryptobacteroides excrementigallinarum]|nr:membrane protein insertase YidC [Candidatus Cryptobacteroides excrementigallinarum]